MADFTSTEVCDGEETDFQSTSTGSVNDWNWNFGDGSTDNGSSVSNGYSAAGTYDVELAVESSDGCLDTVTNTVTVFANPTAHAPKPTHGLGAACSLVECAPDSEIIAILS